MIRKKEHSKTLQVSPIACQKIGESKQLSKSLEKIRNFRRFTYSHGEINTKSFYIVNDHLISKLNPKKTSVDLTSFIQVFRKKVRQTTIAKQFQNSLVKFKSLSEKRSSNYIRQNGGFIGSYKKQNEILVQSHKLDDKLKKVIISDLEFKERKRRLPLSYSEESLLENQTIQQNQQTLYQLKTNKILRKTTLSYGQSNEYQESENKTRYFSTVKDSRKCKQNPEQVKLNDQTPEEKGKTHIQGFKKAESIFTNRRLETISSYQRPNLMYNLSLYRKRHNYNTIKKIKKKTVHTEVQQTSFD